IPPRGARRSMATRRPRVFLVAGEVSGDLHGADLAAELLTLAPEVRLEGIGGRRMAGAGVALIEDRSDWGVKRPPQPDPAPSTRPRRWSPSGAAGGPSGSPRSAPGCWRCSPSRPRPIGRAVPTQPSSGIPRGGTGRPPPPP